MNPKQDAKHLKTSPLLRQAFEDFRALLIERWTDSDDPQVQTQSHAGIRAIGELAETLNDRIDAALGDEDDRTE